MGWDGMGTIVIVTNALVAGKSVLAGDSPAGTGGEFRSGRHGINSHGNHVQEAGKEV